IGECIESVLAQTLRPFEIIVNDDHSVDNSWDVISGFQRRYSDLLKCHRHEQNLGMLKNANYGARKATGELISFMDGDDRWLPRKLECEWAALERNPSARMAYSNVYTIDDEGRRTGIWYDGSGDVPPSGDLFPQVWTWSVFASPRTVFRHELMFKADLEALNYTDEAIDIFLDLDFKLRATSRFPVEYSGEALVEYRLHGEGIHNSSIERVFKDLLFVYLKNMQLLAERSQDETSRLVSDLIRRLYDTIAPLQTAADERLQLVERLDAECRSIRHAAEERLALIHRLEEVNAAMRKQNAELQKICEERDGKKKRADRTGNNPKDKS
ncbi:glycosyltransferase, partial [bacterium]